MRHPTRQELLQAFEFLGLALPTFTSRRYSRRSMVRPENYATCFAYMLANSTAKRHKGEDYRKFAARALKGKRIVELGARSGLFHTILRELGAKPIGIEINPNEVADAKELGASKVILGNAEELSRFGPGNPHYLISHNFFSSAYRRGLAGFKMLEGADSHDPLMLLPGMEEMRHVPTLNPENLLEQLHKVHGEKTVQIHTIQEPDFIGKANWERYFDVNFHGELNQGAAFAPYRILISGKKQRAGLPVKFRKKSRR